MAVDLDLAIYLLIFGFVDQALMAPAPVRSDLGDHESSVEATNEGRYDRKRDTAPSAKDQPYLSLRVDGVEISKNREDDIVKYHMGNRLFKRDIDGRGTNSEVPSVAERTYGDEVGSSLARNRKDSGKPTGFQAVSFETALTINRDNVPEAAHASLDETRQATDESSPCHEKEHSRRDIPGKPKSPTKAKDTSWKRRITGIVNFMRALRKTVRKRENTKLEAKDNESTTEEPDEFDEGFTDDFADTPIHVFTDNSSKQENNETSQRQELDNPPATEGSLGFLLDFLPDVLPILQDLSDPNSNVDLSSLLEAVLPRVGALFNPEDPGTPNFIQQIVSAVTTILGGPDGQGLDFAGLVGPLVQIAGPFIVPIGGPILTYLVRTLTNPDALLSIIRSVLGAVLQAGPDGTPAILNTAIDFIAATIGDLNPGAAGGLDVGAIVQAVTTGTLTALSGGSGAKFSAKPHGAYAPYGGYGPYGTGPVQAASVNSLQTSPEVVVPPDSFKRKDFLNKQPITKAANDVLHQTIRLGTSRKPQRTRAKKPNQRPPPPFQNFFQEFGTSPLQAFAANTGDGGATYPAYGNYIPQYGAVPAYSANPLSLVFSSLQNVTTDGIQLVASLINASFGISGASSIDTAPPAGYGPPTPYKPPATYG